MSGRPGRTDPIGGNLAATDDFERCGGCARVSGSHDRSQREMSPGKRLVSQQHFDLDSVCDQCLTTGRCQVPYDQADDQQRQRSPHPLDSESKSSADITRILTPTSGVLSEGGGRSSNHSGGHARRLPRLNEGVCRSYARALQYCVGHSGGHRAWGLSGDDSGHFCHHRHCVRQCLPDE